MAGLMYNTDKRRMLPQLERVSTYLDTKNVTRHTVLKKPPLSVPIFNLKDEDLAGKIIKWSANKNRASAGDIFCQAFIEDRLSEIHEIQNYLSSGDSPNRILNWLFAK